MELISNNKMADHILKIILSRQNGSMDKMETAVAWIALLQNGDSPIDRLREKDIQEIIVYGAADLGQLLVREAILKDYKISAIVDKKIEAGGYSYRGIPVINVESLKSDKYKSKYIIITPMNYFREIKEELNGMGINRLVSLRELL